MKTAQVLILLAAYIAFFTGAVISIGWIIRGVRLLFSGCYFRSIAVDAFLSIMGGVVCLLIVSGLFLLMTTISF